MDLVDLALQSESIHEQAAVLLVEGFHEPRGWSTVDAAGQEVRRVIDEGFARAMLEGETLLGWVGGCPHPGYDGHVCELHPMVVRPGFRRRGIGRQLAAAFETEARRRGALTAFLGTDDDAGMTSLSDVDLYDNLPARLADVRDRGRGHPFLFYRELGYVVTGVMPDANGAGRPDIYMAKSLH